MSGFTYSGDTDLIIMTCPVCGVTYAIPATLQANAISKGQGKIQWFCCNGHQLGYHGKSDAEKRAEDAEARATRASQRADATRDLLKDTENRLRAQKGATTKAKKRHAAALCPCCNRSFVQLRRHLETQHPEYKP